MGEGRVDEAIAKLGAAFRDLDLSFHAMDHGQAGDVSSSWPGSPDEDVVVCVFRGRQIEEPFHRQDFFFVNYAYRNGYEALSATHDNLIRVCEGECYIGQPYSGYALRANSPEEAVILGVLVRKEVFFREYLPLIYADADLFRFFVSPKANRFSDEFIHLRMPSDHPIRTVLELMAVEYARAHADAQSLLKSLLQTLLLEIAREYRIQRSQPVARTTSERIVAYMDSHSDVVTLKSVAAHFGYHPNYVSGLLHRELGRTFTDLLLERRMERAVLLMRNTTLSIEEISSLLGYSDHSNFYKAFRGYFGTTPRAYARLDDAAKLVEP